MSEWVKFHAELTRGAKRGLKRAHRFVYLELSLAARAGSGVVELPVGMGDVDGVVDMLGGDAKEVRAALEVLCGGNEPMVRFDGDSGARRLVVVAWERWNSSPGGSTERVRRFRERVSQDMKRVTRNAETVSVTHDETDPQRYGNAPREEKSREEKSRPPVRSPVGRDGPEPAASPDEPAPCSDQGLGLPQDAPALTGRADVATPTQTSLLGAAEQSPKASTGRTAALEAQVWDAYMAGWRAYVGRGAEPRLTDGRRSKIRARLKEHDVDTVAAAAAGIWRSWWHVQNGQTGFDLVVRDAAHVERFARQEHEAPTFRGRPVQPPIRPEDLSEPTGDDFEWVETAGGF